jgi:predicted amidophosphoribosyltransferase
VWEDWLDLVLPRCCAGCARPGTRWCRACSAELRSSATPALLPPPVEGIALTATAGEHAGLLRAAVLAQKSQSVALLRIDLVALLGRALALVVAVARAARRWHPPVALVAVPPSKWRPWRLPVAELAAQLALTGDGLVPVPLLSPGRRRRAQKGLGGAERAANMAGALRVTAGRARAAPRSAILLDDVITTGATIAEAARALGEVGITTLGAAAIAHAAPVGHPRALPAR